MGEGATPGESPEAAGRPRFLSGVPRCFCVCSVPRPGSESFVSRASRLGQGLAGPRLCAAAWGSPWRCTSLVPRRVSTASRCPRAPCPHMWPSARLPFTFFWINTRSASRHSSGGGWWRPIHQCTLSAPSRPVGGTWKLHQFGASEALEPLQSVPATRPLAVVCRDHEPGNGTSDYFFADEWLVEGPVKCSCNAPGHVSLWMLRGDRNTQTFNRRTSRVHCATFCCHPPRRSRDTQHFPPHRVTYFC